MIYCMPQYWGIQQIIVGLHNIYGKVLYDIQRCIAQAMGIGNGELSALIETYAIGAKSAVRYRPLSETAVVHIVGNLVLFVWSSFRGTHAAVLVLTSNKGS